MQLQENCLEELKMRGLVPNFFLLIFKVPPKLIHNNINEHYRVAKVFLQKSFKLAKKNKIISF